MDGAFPTGTSPSSRPSATLRKSPGAKSGFSGPFAFHDCSSRLKSLESPVTSSEGTAQRRAFLLWVQQRLILDALALHRKKWW